MRLDVEQLRTWIGRTVSIEDSVTPRLVDAFAATLAPNLAPVADGEAPIGLHWCLREPASPMAELGPDGHPARGGFLPPVPLQRRMWAGGEVASVMPLRLGDVVTRTSTVEDVGVKEGRSGPLCFVTVRHAFTTGRGLAVSERHDIVFRDPDPPGGADRSPAEPPATAEAAWRIDASPVLLFRFSALTFNGHRIHYDVPYATSVEGAAGLLVHGPLQAALLMNLFAARTGAVPPRFRYRNVAPLVAGAPFIVACAVDAEGALTGWTADAAGHICMKAHC